MKQQAHIVAVRDVAVRKLRDMTVAVALAAAASMGLIAWVSAATIPGSTGASGPTGSAATGVDDQPIFDNGGGFVQKQPRYRVGPGVAVSGGSR